MLAPAQRPLEIAGTIITAPLAGGMGMAGEAALTTLGLARAAGTTLSGIGLARALGQAGEAASGLVRNTRRIASATETAAYRVPDGLTASTLSEVKNMARLSLTNQIRDFAAFASETGRTFDLYVRATTEFSGSLQSFIKANSIAVKILQ